MCLTDTSLYIYIEETKPSNIKCTYIWRRINKIKLQRRYVESLCIVDEIVASQSCKYG